MQFAVCERAGAACGVCVRTGAVGVRTGAVCGVCKRTGTVGVRTCAVCAKGDEHWCSVCIVCDSTCACDVCVMCKRTGAVCNVRGD